MAVGEAGAEEQGGVGDSQGRPRGLFLLRKRDVERDLLDPDLPTGIQDRDDLSVRRFRMPLDVGRNIRVRGVAVLQIGQEIGQGLPLLVAGDPWGLSRWFLVAGG